MQIRAYRFGTGWKYQTGIKPTQSKLLYISFRASPLTIHRLKLVHFPFAIEKKNNHV